MMVTKEELEADMVRWKGVNPYLFEAARHKLKNGEYDKLTEVIAPTIPIVVEVVDKVLEDDTLKIVEVADEKVQCTEVDLWAMKKNEQVALLKKLGSKKVPRFENGRVVMLKKLLGIK